jgi:hypothetical protein
VANGVKVLLPNDAALAVVCAYPTPAKSGGETMRKVALTISCPHTHERPNSSLSRRGFLGQVMHLGMAAAAASTLLDGYATRVLAAPGRGIKFSHGTGLCNMPLFYAAEKNIFEKYGIDDDVVMTPMAGTSAIQLATAQVEMGVIFTLLEAVIKESPELWERLKVRSSAS